MNLNKHEYIGMIVAQQCAAPAVQTSLSAFHQVGSNTQQKSKSYSDYLRLKTSINESITYIYPKESVQVQDLMRKIENVTLNDLVESYSLRPSKYLLKYAQYHDDISSETRNCLQLKLKQSVMCYHKFDPFDIKYIIESHIDDIVVIPSPLKDFTLEVVYKTSSHRNVVYLSQFFMNESTSKIQIKGIPNIWPIQILDDKYIECRGCNIVEVNNHPLIDSYYSYTNNISENYKYYGCITTKKIIHKYLKDMFGNDIDSLALEILVCNMMYQGPPLPVSQDGTDKQGRSLLFKMTYERFGDHVRQIPYKGISNIESIYDKIAVGHVKPQDNSKLQNEEV